MGFSIALDLRRLVEALPLLAGFSILPVDALAGPRLDDGEHSAVGQISVMSDGKQAAARLVLVGRHPFPEVARVVAPERSHGRVGHDPAGLLAVVPEDDVAVKI